MYNQYDTDTMNASVDDWAGTTNLLGYVGSREFELFSYEPQAPDMNLEVALLEDVEEMVARSVDELDSGEGSPLKDVLDEIQARYFSER